MSEKENNVVKPKQKEPGLSSTINLCAKAIYEVYFQPRKEALPRHFRFLSSFLGSIIFLQLLITSPVIGALNKRDLLEPSETITRNLNIEIIYSTTSLMLFALSISIVYASIFAIIIATGYSKHGPIRYFIAGIVLPTFTILAVQSVT